MYTVGSLFSGIGGIDLAFSWAGFDVRWQVEIEPFCQAVLRKHAAQYWPNARIHDDVTTAKGGELGSVDVMVGGFPCQDISIAGNRKGIKQGTRSGLWIEFARLIGEIRPRCVLLENVAAITTLGGAQVIGDLTALGYSAEWGIIPASAVGAPHRRERWFCVAYTEHNGHATASQRGIDGTSVQRASQGQDSAEQSQRLHTSAIMAYSACSRNTEQVSRSRETRQKQNEDTGRRQLEYASKTNRAVVYPTSERLEGIDRNKSPFSESSESSRGISQPVLGRAVDGLSQRLDNSKWPARPDEAQKEWEQPRATSKKAKDHAARIKALGNAVVPQVVYPLAVAIKEYLEAQDL